MFTLILILSSSLVLPNPKQKNRRPEWIHYGVCLTKRYNTKDGDSLERERDGGTPLLTTEESALRHPHNHSSVRTDDIGYLGYH